MMSSSLRFIVSALLVAFLAAAGGPLAAQEGDKTASISGKWKGKYLESLGTRGELSLELSEEKGMVTGSCQNSKMENGRRIADTLAWSMLIDGRVYVVHGIISDGGKRLTLDYTFIEDKVGRLQKVTGIATLQKE
jgi:hypothetical protein